MSDHVRQIIRYKRQWHHQVTPEEVALGFRGWHSRGYLPHFDAPGLQQFITYRLTDAMPAQRRSEWEAFLHLEDEREKRKEIEAYLDRSHGGCHLRDERIAALVQENLLHFDGRDYRVLAWVIMPNHVHALIEVWQKPLAAVVKSWKSYTAKEANKILGHAGAFWQEDYFDTYMRDEEQFRKTVQYIENNPTKAQLVRAPVDWRWSSTRYRGEPGPEVPQLMLPSSCGRAVRAPQRGRSADGSSAS